MQYFTSPPASNRLIIFKLKRDLKYKDHLHFEPVYTHIMSQAVASLKSHDKFYEDTSIRKGLSSKDMFR